MSDDQVNVEQLLAALQRNGIPLPFEIGTFLVLQAAEQALVLEATEKRAGPPCLGPADIWMTGDGEIGVTPSQAAGVEQEACRALVVLLGELLVRSAPGVPPMLLEIVERGPSDGEWTLMRLRDDLEASLVPLNRGALRRVLARLLREVRREADRAQAAPAPDTRAVDRELDALFGIEGEEPAAPLPESEPPPLEPEREGGAEGEERAGGGRREAPRDARERPRAAKPRFEPEDDDPLAELDARGGGRGTARLGIALAVLAAVLAAAFVLVGRERARSMLGLVDGPATPAQAPAAAPSAPRRYGELRVRSTPPRAQVLMFVGEGPAIVRDLPIGVAHEFVATAQDKLPSRAVVPSDASWKPGERYELALQLDDPVRGRSPESLGRSRLPDALGTPGGQLGEVRVVTSPPGAKVYQLIGFTPDVRVENIALSGEPIELLVYLDGYAPARAVVRESDFQERDGKQVAEIDVKLARRPK